MSGHISSDHSRSASRSSQTPRLSQGQTRDSMPRHSFGRTSRVSNPNVFSDEYSLEPIDADQIDRAPSPASIASSTTLRSIHHPQKTVSTATTENENPFGDDARVSFEEAHRSSLPQKGVGNFANNRNSVNSVNNSPFAVQRNQSVSSRFSIPRALSPYTGATGPSHPYGMYPQVGVSRSPSVGSTSTIRQPDRPLSETNGPQHPYAMYTQNVVEEGMDDDVIPVGFPGHNPPYQPPPSRRDDDVGDIIGPDGHTEPLPPYSRYPTGVIPKPPTPENMADMNHSPEDHQQLNSLSREPPVSETSSRALVADYSGSSGNNGNNGNNDRSGGQRAGAATGIMAFEEKLKQKGKKTACCGLPVWTLVLICTVMLIGGSIGGVIGGVLGTKRAAEADKQAEAQTSGPHIVTVTASPQKDYSTMTSTPTNLRSAPTGTFYVPAMLKNSSGMCVEDDTLKSAWMCMNKPNNIEITIDEGSNGHHSIIFPNPTPTSSYTYGPQPPYMTQPTIPLGMAIDTSDTSLGPALFFVAKFDKLVVVPESKFQGSSISARSWPGDDSFVSSLLSRKGVAQPGEKPWFCWWNQTQMEFFIYVNQTTSDTSTDATATTDGDMTASTATAHLKRDDPISDYPRKIKWDERRDQAGASAPYCQQMQVDSLGHASPIPENVISIKENEPTPTTTYINSEGGSQTYTARAQYATPCYCLSFSD
ncbi:hypothetical protein N7532_004573 [Penicillium argentinense]|uniref:DUF7820 domain-containing protein n=1 Tax=Penicillium argentinense TaxID=1131581 RepID=A0A9W9FPR0_9EURO|nr:uncharacterized protein N7532_004573 [Penicillium argentinense]KAJ5104044.1 hypothetical protein N7532_004573 [Penicillium argentinense]